MLKLLVSDIFTYHGPGIQIFFELIDLFWSMHFLDFVEYFKPLQGDMNSKEEAALSILGVVPFFEDLILVFC